MTLSITLNGTKAVLAILSAHDTDAKSAYTAYQEQLLEFGDERRMTGLALVWIAARNAADIA